MLSHVNDRQKDAEGDLTVSNCSNVNGTTGSSLKLRLLQREELQRILNAQPGYIGSRGETSLDGIGNYVLNIMQSPGSSQVAHKLWFFDSRSYTYYGSNGSATGAYGQVMQSQLGKS